MISEQLSQLHHRAMAVPAGWSETDFENLLAQPGVFLVISSLPKYAGESARGASPLSHRAMPTAAQNLVAFAVGRAVLNEAELLTLAVDPRLQRRGLGRACLNEFEMRAAAEGAEVLHLEVAETNHAARALYTSVGWHDVGRRRSYYTSPTGRIDAILMTKQLAAD